MKKGTVRILALLLTFILCLSLAACGKGDGSSTDSGAGGSESAGSGSTLDVLNIGLGNSQVMVNPFDISGVWSGGSGITYAQGYLVYDSLFYIDGETGEWLSRTLEDFYWEDDLTLVCQLKPNIYFSNGDRLEGDDVLYSLTLIQQSRQGNYYKPCNAEKSSVSDDGLTITLVYDHVYAAAYKYLEFSIVNREYVESVGGENIDWYDTAQVVGSGPYVATEYIPDNSMTFVKRDDYWGLSYGYDFPIEKIIATQYSDQTTMMIDFETGELDVAFDISATDGVRAQNGEIDDCVFDKVDMNQVVVLILSDENVYLQDAKVREAICHAINTDQIADVIAGIYGAYAKSSFAQGMNYFVDGHTYEYDPDYSRQLLAEAGYSDGDISLKYICISDAYQTDLAESIQYYMAEVGIDLTIEPLDFGQFISLTVTADGTDFFVFSVSSGSPDGEPHQMLENWLSNSATVIVNREDPELDALINSAVQTHNTEERAKLYGELQDYWYDNFDLVPLYEISLGYVYNPTVLSKCYISGSQTLNVLSFVPAG